MRRVLVAKGRGDARVAEVLALARERGVGVEHAGRSRLDELFAGSHQGVVALLVPAGYARAEDALRLATERGEEPFLLALDQVTDPQNLGAVLRTAEAAGAHGVLVHERGSAALTPAVHKASAGASMRVPVLLAPNLANALRDLQREGLWLVGAVPEGAQAHYEAKLTGPLCLCLGSEGEGLRRLTRDLCDALVRIPMRGKLASLNVAAAAAVLCFERVRQLAQVPVEPRARAADRSAPRG